MTKALFILEKPWWDLSKENRRDASVLPFFQGLERLESNFSLFYSTFYGPESLKGALERIKTSTFKRCWVYIAAHGSDSEVGDIGIKTVLNDIRTQGGNTIEGLVLGTCSIGKSQDALIEGMKGSGLRWLFSYTEEAEWFTSTVMDVSIFQELMALPPRSLGNEAQLRNAFSSALHPFNPAYPIDPDPEGESAPLQSSIRILIRPPGKGHRTKDITADVIAQTWPSSSSDT